MDLAEIIIAITGALAAGSGGTYAVQRLRNGNGRQPAPEEPQGCEHKHDQIRAEFRQAHESVCLEVRETKSEIKDSIHELATEVRVGFETIRADAKDIARAEIDRHERSPYHQDG